MALAFCLALFGFSASAHAAGLGKVLVFSGLGQPLRADTLSTIARSLTPEGGALEQMLVAKEKALKEANDRVVLLEKNVVNLQKLLELKRQSPAEAQPLAAEKAVPVKVKKTVEIHKTKKKQKPRPV